MSESEYIKVRKIVFVSETKWVQGSREVSLSRPLRSVQECAEWYREHRPDFWRGWEIDFDPGPDEGVEPGTRMTIRVP
jgi:hypothetical protein